MSEDNTKVIDFFTYKAKAIKVFDKNNIQVNINTKYNALSNYFEFSFLYKGETFSTNEHAFHWEKFTEEWYKKEIQESKTPNESKQLGCQKGSQWTKAHIRDSIKKSKQLGIVLRKDWDDAKDNIMYEINKAKYTQNQKLKELLLSTGDKIIREASPYDSYWGIGPDGKGKNKLGEILMRIRQEFK